MIEDLASMVFCYALVVGVCLAFGTTLAEVLVPPALIVLAGWAYLTPRRRRYWR